VLRNVALPRQLRNIRKVERKQSLHPFGQKTNAAGPLATGARERFEQIRRQAFMQGKTPGGIDVDAVALNAVSRGAVALINGALTPDFFKPCAKVRPPIPPPMMTTWSGADLAPTIVLLFG
jgi:hypothetical protein